MLAIFLILCYYLCMGNRLHGATDLGYVPQGPDRGEDFELTAEEQQALGSFLDLTRQLLFGEGNGAISIQPDAYHPQQENYRDALVHRLGILFGCDIDGMLSASEHEETVTIEPWLKAEFDMLEPENALVIQGLVRQVELVRETARAPIAIREVEIPDSRIDRDGTLRDVHHRVVVCKAVSQ